MLNCEQTYFRVLLHESHYKRWQRKGHELSERRSSKREITLWLMVEKNGIRQQHMGDMCNLTKLCAYYSFGSIKIFICCHILLCRCFCIPWSCCLWRYCSLGESVPRVQKTSCFYIQISQHSYPNQSSHSLGHLLPAQATQSPPTSPFPRQLRMEPVF